MGAFEQMGNQSSDEVVRKRVIPSSDGDPTLDEPDDNPRSPTDEETTRDAPEQTVNLSDDEVMRKRVIPTDDGESSQDEPDDDRSPTDEETTRDVSVEPLPDDGDDSEEVLLTAIGEFDFRLIVNNRIKLD